MEPRKTGDIAESPLASEPADLDSLDSELDRAAEFIAEICERAKASIGFTKDAVRIFAAPFSEAFSAAAQTDTAIAQSEFVALLLTQINAAKDPYLALRCLPIIFDLQCGGESEQEVADSFGLGRSAVSALCVELRTRLRVPPGRGMRRDETREKYSARQSGRRAKPMPSPWPFRGLMARVKSSAQ